MYAFFRTRALCNITVDASYKMLLCHLSLSVWQFYVLNTAACIALCGLYIRHVNVAIVPGFRTVTGRSQFIVLSIIKRVLYQLRGLYRVTCNVNENVFMNTSIQKQQKIFRSFQNCLYSLGSWRNQMSFVRGPQSEHFPGYKISQFSHFGQIRDT